MRNRRAVSVLSALAPRAEHSMRILSALRLPFVAAALLHGNAIHAQDAYPSRNIRVIVPFSPGTGIDILARTIGQKLAERWKTSILVDNRPGASGNIGTEAAAKSVPDGYTLLMTASTIVTNRGFFTAMPYDAIKDFAPVMPLALGSLAFVTHPSLPVKSVREFVSLAKARPGEISSVLREGDTKDTLARQGLTPTGGTPEALARLTRTDLERWLRVVREARIQPD